MAAEIVHPDDLAVDRLALAMKKKLAKKRHDGRGGWEDPDQCSANSISEMLVEHVEKGDPIDVVNFCMMLFNRGERIVTTRPADNTPAIETLAKNPESVGHLGG